MQNTRKLIALLLLAALALCCLAGCAGGGTPAAGKGLHIVATIFPLYDWTRQILGERAENAELTLLMDNGVDLHNFQVTAGDIVKLSNCDLFLYIGGESDAWVEDTLAQVQNDGLTALNLMELLGDRAREEEHIEGMQEEEDHGEEEDGLEYDEHVWLSLRNAEFFCGQIASALGQIDEGNRAVYEQNAQGYIAKLQALDEDYQAAVDAANRDTLLFGDRFPFRYLAADYGLKYYAAFSGCSAETEASFETIAFLAGKVDELDLDVILRIESSDGSIPETIRRTSAAKDQKILVMDSLQAKTAADAENGVDYLAVMESNLSVLKEALA